MTVSIAPADEACLALVDRINAGTAYILDVEAKYSRFLVDPLEEIDGLRVDLAHDVEQVQHDRLDGLDNSLHTIRVWIRAKLPDDEPESVQSFAYLRKQLVDRLDNWNSSDRRVQVWDTENEEIEQPMKDQLRQKGLFVACVVLHVQVLA